MNIHEANLSSISLGSAAINSKKQLNYLKQTLKPTSIGLISSTWSSIHLNIRGLTPSDMNSCVCCLFCRSYACTKCACLFLEEQQLQGHPCLEFIEVAPKEICKDTQHIATVFKDILDKGGEGIILRDPKSPYEPGRSDGFLKHMVPLPLLPN